MNSVPLIVADADIPFLRGRLEPFANVRYLSQDEFNPSTVNDADAMLIRTRTRCNKELLQHSKVKTIATATIGMDQFNIPECKEMGIKIHNAPGCNAPGVAQYVWASLLRAVVNSKGFHLAIVGCGNVGSIVKEWGELMGAEIRVCDPPKAFETGMKQYPLEELLPWADAVTFHTPYTKEGKWPTHYLLNNENVGLMKKNAFVINAARGPVTQTTALIDAIRNKGLRAIIDCWEGEPKIDSQLLQLAEVATYHIAGYSLEGKQRATRMAVEAVGNELGFKADTSDLAEPYVPKTSLSEEAVIQSFDPMPIMQQLKANPDIFDKLRANYKYRKEV